MLSARLSSWCVCSEHAPVHYSRSFLFYFMAIIFIYWQFISSAEIFLGIPVLCPVPHFLCSWFLPPTNSLLKLLRIATFPEKSNLSLIICASCLNPRFFCLLSALCLQFQYLDWQTLNFFIQWWQFLFSAQWWEFSVLSLYWNENHTPCQYSNDSHLQLTCCKKFLSLSVRFWPFMPLEPNTSQKFLSFARPTLTVLSLRNPAIPNSHSS